MATPKENINLDNYFDVRRIRLYLKISDKELINSLLLLIRGGDCLFTINSGCKDQVAEAFLKAGYFTVTAKAINEVILVSKKPILPEAIVSKGIQADISDLVD